MSRRPAAGRRRGPLQVTVIAAPRWRRAARGLARWTELAAPARARGAVVVALVGDGRMRQLNHRFRGKDAATDVLSFPAEGPVDGKVQSQSHKSLDISYLGDIVIACGVASRQAEAYGHGVPSELRILALHGLLHLLGYDHERDQGQMQRLETRLRRAMRVPAGVLDRASMRPSRR